FIDDGEGGAAPRLAQVRPSKELLGVYFEQLRNGMRELARAGLAHGDLSRTEIANQEAATKTTTTTTKMTTKTTKRGPRSFGRKSNGYASGLH
ncbi:hypothetical protein AB0C16_28905, partial [Nonomuraea sp. NPDC048916]